MYDDDKQKSYQFFRKELPKLIEEGHLHQFVLISNQKIIDTSKRNNYINPIFL